MSEEDLEYVVVDPFDLRQSSEDPTVTSQPPHVRAKIQKWLCPSEYTAESGDYNKHLRSYCPNTGEWLRKSDQYFRWHDVGETALWVNGIPGSGKSVVAASLANDFDKHERAVVLYFFFRYANVANRTPKQMIRDWLSQLLDHSTLLQARLKDLLERSISHESVTFEDLWTPFVQAAVAFPKIYCVADALDEMEPGNDWILHRLAELGRQTPSTLKMLLTSRQSPHIEKVYKEPLVLSINLDRRLIDHDIATYIHHLLSDNPAMHLSNDQSKLIESTVQSKANGLFIYAKLMMDEILANAKNANIEALLGSLPMGMDEMYTTLLSEHSRRSGVDAKIQKLILQWITHATRPLRLLEAAELVLLVSTEYGSIQETKNTVRSACGPLLTVLPDETLQVIHHSFTEFLIDTARTSGYPAFEAENVHTDAAVTSIDYIRSCSLAEKANLTGHKKNHCMFEFGSRQRDAFFMEHTLLHYAVNNWMIHTSKSRTSNSVIISALDRLLAASEDHFAFWLGIWHISGQRKLKDVPQRLHIISFFGLKDYAVKLCDKSTDLDARDSSGRTPLSYACDGGHRDMVSFLLDRGASASITSKFGVSPLHYACASNRPDIVKRLLQASGADPFSETQNPEDEDGRIADKRHYPEMCDNRQRFGKSALQHVCNQGHIECVRTILASLPPEKRRLGPLHWAAKGGRAEVVDLILKQYNGDPDAYDEKGNTPLCLASRQHSPATVQRLLDAGANVLSNSTGIDRDYRVPDPTHYRRKETDPNTVTPLHAWALGHCPSRQSHAIEAMTKTSTILIEAGCDVNAKDAEGKTPLFYWVTFSGSACSAFLEVLLRHGADASMEDSFGCTPLHLLKYDSAEAHIRTLLSAGGDINKPRSTDGRTPLMCALKGWSSSKPADWPEYVEKYGVDPNAQDWDGRTVLHYILSSEAWTAEKVKYWLQAGADPGVVDEQGRNCLFGLHTSYGTAKEKEEGCLVEALISAGLDISSKDHLGYNLALKSSTSWDLERLKRLHSYGVDLMARTHLGRTALHLLAASEASSPDPPVKQRLEFLRFFMANGVEINAQDHSGDTMLHIAFRNHTLANPRSFLETALELGAEANVRNYDGRNAAHMVSGAPRHKNRSSRKEQTFDLLLKSSAKVDFDLRDLHGTTPLHLAATRDAVRVQKLLCAGSIVTALDHRKRSVLHYAASANNSNALGVTIQHLRDNSVLKLIHQQDCNGRAALHDAVRSGALECIQILLDSSADPNVEDSRGRRPLHIASEIEGEQCLRHLRCSTKVGSLPRKMNWYSKPAYKSNPGESPYGESLRKSQLQQDGTGDDPGSRTCGIASRSRDIVRVLLRAGADPCAEDVDGSDALDLAVQTNSKEVIHVLSSMEQKSKPYGTARERQRCHNLLVQLKIQCCEKECETRSLLARDLVTTQEEATELLSPAIIEGDEEFIEALLDLGADPLYADEEEPTALHLAISNGLLTITKMLVGQYKDLDALPSDLLHTAVRREQCNLGMTKQLIELGCDKNAVVSLPEEFPYDRVDSSLSVVHNLAMGEHWWQLVALVYLLESGADIEVATSQGRTALQLAISGRLEAYGPKGFWRKESVAVLLDHGAKVNFVDGNGKTPLIEAFNEGTNILKTLISHGADVTFGPAPPIGHAVLSNDVAVVEVVLKTGADPNAIYNDSHTTRPPEPILLQVARADFCSRGGSSPEKRANAERIVELLIDAGADASVVSDDGTPLFIAVLRARGIVSPFLSHRIDLEIRDSQGMTPFLTACAVKYPDETLDQMVQAGADPLAVDHSGKTALHHVDVQGSGGYWKDYTKADLLLAYKVPINARDTMGTTALHCAIQQGRFMYPSIIRRLLDAGADPAIPFPDASSRSMLHFVVPHLAEDGQNYMAPPSMFRPLIARFVGAGLDKEARDDNGNTPIFGYVARQPGYDDEYDEENRYPDLEEQRRDLLEYNIHAKNNAGEGLLHIVAKRSRQSDARNDTKNMFKLLWELGLDPQAEDGSQRTPLDVAAACGNTGILDLFAPKR